MYDRVFEILRKSRLLPINTWKAISIFMVLGIHITGSYVLNYGSIRSLHQVLMINVLVSGAVAMFLFASGYGLAKKYGEDDEVKWGSFVFSKLRKLLPEYILWSFAYEVFQYKLYGKLLSVEIMIEDLLWGKAMYHLYYMVFFIQLMIIFPWLFRLMRLLGYKLLFLAGLVQWISLRYVMYPWPSIVFTSYIFYFVWGMAAAWRTGDYLEDFQIRERHSLVSGKQVVKNEAGQGAIGSLDGIKVLSKGCGKGKGAYLRLSGGNTTIALASLGLGFFIYVLSCSIKFVEYESQYNTAKTPVRLLGYDYTYFFQAIATIFLAMQLVPLVDRWLEKPTAGFLRKSVRELVRLLGELSPLIYYVHPMILGMGIRLGGRYTVNAGGIKVLVLWLLLTGGSVIGAMGLRWLRREGMKGLFG